jgi:hypothetical protein
MKTYIVFAIYSGECCARSHGFPLRVPAGNKEEAASIMRKIISDRENDPGEIFVFETPSEIETLQDVLDADEGDE